MKLFVFFFFTQIPLLFSLQIPSSLQAPSPSAVSLQNHKVALSENFIKSIDTLLSDFKIISNKTILPFQIGEELSKLYELSELLQSTEFFSVKVTPLFQKNTVMMVKTNIFNHLLDFAKELKTESFLLDQSFSKILISQVNKHANTLLSAIVDPFFETLESSLNKEDSIIETQQVPVFENTFSSIMKAFLLGLGSEEIYIRLQENLKKNSFFFSCGSWQQKILSLFSFFQKSEDLNSHLNNFVSHSLKNKSLFFMALLKKNFESFQKDFCLPSSQFQPVQNPLHQWIVDLQYLNANTVDDSFRKRTEKLLRDEQDDLLAFLIEYFVQICRVNSKITNDVLSVFFKQTRFLLLDPSHSASLERVLLQNFSAVFTNENDLAQFSQHFLVFFLTYVTDHLENFPSESLSPNFIETAIRNLVSSFSAPESFDKKSYLSASRNFNILSAFLKKKLSPQIDTPSVAISVLDSCQYFLTFLGLLQKNTFLTHLLDFTRRLKRKNYLLKDKAWKQTIASYETAIYNALSSIKNLLISYLKNVSLNNPLKLDSIRLDRTVSLIAQALTFGYEDREITDALKEALTHTSLLSEIDFEKNILKWIQLRQFGDFFQTDTKRIQSLHNAPLAFFFLKEIVKIVSESQTQKWLDNFYDFFKNRQKSSSFFLKNTLKSIEEGDLSASSVLLNILIHCPKLFSDRYFPNLPDHNDYSIRTFLLTLVEKCKNPKLQQVALTYLRSFRGLFEPNVFCHLDSNTTEKDPSVLTFVFTDSSIPYFEEIIKTDGSIENNFSFFLKNFNLNFTSNGDFPKSHLSFEETENDFKNEIFSGLKIILYNLVLQEKHKTSFSFVFFKENEKVIDEYSEISQNFSSFMNNLSQAPSLDYSTKKFHFDLLDKSRTLYASKDYLSDPPSRFSLSFRCTFKMEVNTQKNRSA